ncbi:MAG TPA: hypothetical protein VME70_07025 [Mycobacteriales bacterium]|nr:hypothetical protein [Mycobacteriales bacterium]
MKRIALAGAVAASVIAVVLAGTALAAGSSHTLRLTTTRLQFVNTSSTTFVQADTVDRKGKKAGYETITCDDSGHQISCSMTLSLQGGVLYGHLAIPITSEATTKVSGAITGGLGRYAGAKGTVKGSITGKHSSLTVKYH